METLFFWFNIIFQYIQQMIRHDNTKIEDILEPPEGQDEGVWKYEHLRYILKFKAMYSNMFLRAKKAGITFRTILRS